MRLSFKELHLKAKVKLGGHDLLMSGTIVGWNGSGWVRADGETVEAKFILVEPGYPNEYCAVARGAVCLTEENTMATGTNMVLGRQRVGFVAAPDTLVFDIESLHEEAVCDHTTGDSQAAGPVPMEEPEAPRSVRNRKRSNQHDLDGAGTVSVPHGYDSV